MMYQAAVNQAMIQERSPREVFQSPHKVMYHSPNRGEFAPEQKPIYQSQNNAEVAPAQKEKELTLHIHFNGDGVTYPDANDRVDIHYTGKLMSGAQFDSTHGKGAGIPFSFTVGCGEVIVGWDAAIKNIPLGAKGTLTVPSEHAYGAQGVDGVIPPHSDLVFEVELVGVNGRRYVPPAPAPAPVAQVVAPPQVVMPASRAAVAQPDAPPPPTPGWAKSIIRGSQTGKILGFKDFANQIVAIEEVANYQPSPAAMAAKAAFDQQHQMNMMPPTPAATTTAGPAVASPNRTFYQPSIFGQQPQPTQPAKPIAGPIMPNFAPRLGSSVVPPPVAAPVNLAQPQARSYVPVPVNPNGPPIQYPLRLLPPGQQPAAPQLMATTNALPNQVASSPRPVVSIPQTTKATTTFTSPTKVTANGAYTAGAHQMPFANMSNAGSGYVHQAMQNSPVSMHQIIR